MGSQRVGHDWVTKHFFRPESEGPTCDHPHRGLLLQIFKIEIRMWTFINSYLSRKKGRSKGLQRVPAQWKPTTVCRTTADYERHGLNISSTSFPSKDDWGWCLSHIYFDWQHRIIFYLHSNIMPVKKKFSFKLFGILESDLCVSFIWFSKSIDTFSINLAFFNISAYVIYVPCREFS